jgi:two-component system cell cycle response regulator
MLMGAENPSRTKTVLVVDDEPDIVAISRVMLQNAGYSVIATDNGLDAVKIVYDQVPDCIVLDVMMPRMNGYQVCRLLKHDPKTRHIPIILCTVKSYEMDRLYGLTTGADFYLTKPFEPGDLVKLVDDVTRSSPPSKPKPDPISGDSSSADIILTEINLLLDRKLREYTILQHVSRAISGTLNLDALLKTILRSTTTDLGFKKGFFLMIGTGESLEERISTEDGERPPWKGQLKDYPGLQNILQKGQPLVMETSGAKEVIPLELRQTMKGEVIVVPVVAKGKALGAILVDSSENPGLFYTEDTLNFLMTLAGQAGMAIENAQLYTKTLKLSITDGLTDLYNYRYFMERLEAEFSRVKRYKREMSLFILDIDHFKDYNDRYGHLTGDEALRELAGVLQGNTRGVDVVARYGGEEFAVILPETDIEEAIAFAERIRVSAEEAGGHLADLTVSIGVSAYDEHIPKAEDIIRNADMALYEAKRGGRNRVCHQA